jgi:outer membrane receptor for ferrienterochelin and colicins
MKMVFIFRRRKVVRGSWSSLGRVRRRAWVRALTALAWTAASLCAGAAWGQEAPPSPEAGAELTEEGGAGAELADEEGAQDEGEVIVVTGTRGERRRSESPVATEVIGVKEIEASGAQDLAQLLDQRAGLDVRPGLAGSTIRVQGLDPRYVLVMVDGQRVNGRIDGAVDLSRFSTHDIEQVEIVRGAGTSLYGADALGGVINIITRRPVSAQEASLTLVGGELGSLDLRADAGARGARWDARLSGRAGRLDSFDLDPRDPATTGSAQGSWGLGGQARLEPASAWRLDLSADYFRRHTDGVDAQGTGAVFDRRNVTETLASTARLEREREGQRASGALTYRLFRDQFLYDQRGAGALDQAQETVDQTVQLQLQWGDSSGAHAWVAGLDALGERLQTPRLQGGRGQRGRAAVFVQDEWGFAPSASGLLGVRADVDSQFGPNLSPNLAARWAPSDGLALRVAVGRGFRAPSFQELYLLFENPSVNYLVQGQEGLSPERSWDVNASAQWDPSERVGLWVNGFYHWIDDLIAFQTLEAGELGGTTRYTYANLDHAQSRGVEASARVRPWRWGSAELSYTLTDARDADGRALEGRARHQVGLQLSQGYKPWGLLGTVQGLAFGERPFYSADADGDAREEVTLAKPYASLDARLGWEANDFLEIFVGGDNLLDAGEAQRLPLRPRRLYLGLIGTYQ